MKVSYLDKISPGSIIRFHGISLFLGLMPFFIILGLLGAVFGMPIHFNGNQVSSFHALYAIPLLGSLLCIVFFISAVINSIIGFFILSLMKKQFEIEYVEGTPPKKIGDVE